MTKEGVLDLANRVVRPLLDDRAIEEIAVREDIDSVGDPSFFVDVFIAPGTRPLEGDVSIRLFRDFHNELLDAGERRQSYLRFRDRSDESDIGEPGEAH